MDICELRFVSQNAEVSVASFMCAIRPVPSEWGLVWGLENASFKE
jgi:hypothetical protein